MGAAGVSNDIPNAANLSSAVMAKLSGSFEGTQKRKTC
jgi:hypothetical protein